MSPLSLTINTLIIIIILIINYISECVESFEPDFFELGTINYGHLISSQDWIRQKEEDKMLYAMEHVGFMVLTNHGISKQIMDDVWNQTRKFFDTSEDNKNSVLMTKDYIYGYSAEETLWLSEQIEYFKGNQTSNDEEKSIYNNTPPPVDQKEMFAAWIGAPNTSRLDDVLWPSEPLRMKETWIAYYRECEKIASQLLKSFAIILELNSSDYFEQFIDDHMSAMRALNYPKQEKEPPEGSLRCSAHSDYGTFTLLRQDGVGGLQLDINGDDKHWVDVISDQYDFIVNLGNTMKLWTNNRFKSTRHRVVNPRNLKEKERRQSIAFFHNLNGNALIETIPSCKNASSKQYPPIYFKDFLDSLHHGSQTNYDINSQDNELKGEL